MRGYVDFESKTYHKLPRQEDLGWRGLVLFRQRGNDGLLRDGWHCDIGSEFGPGVAHRSVGGDVDVELGNVTT
jgi:hypothetical protein